MTEPERPTYKVQTPADIANLPATMFGYTPQESVVVIGFTGEKGRVGSMQRFDLEQVHTEIDQFLYELPIRCANADRDLRGVMLIVYTDNDPRDYTHIVHRLHDESDLPLMDAMWIRNGRFASYFCADPKCCPLEGNVLEMTEAARAVAGEMVFAGKQQFGTREEIDALFIPGDFDADCQAEALAITDVVARDRILIDVWDAGDLQGATAHWTDIARGSIDGARQAALTLACTFAYMSGDGTRANAALDAMDQDESKRTSLSHILADSLNQGLPPTIFQDIIRDAKRQMAGGTKPSIAD